MATMLTLFRSGLRLTGHDLARFLKRPKQKRGEKFSKGNGHDHVKKAATDVLFVRFPESHQT